MYLSKKRQVALVTGFFAMLASSCGLIEEIEEGGEAEAIALDEQALSPRAAPGLPYCWISFLGRPSQWQQPGLEFLAFGQVSCVNMPFLTTIVEVRMRRHREEEIARLACLQSTLLYRGRASGFPVYFREALPGIHAAELYVTSPRWPGMVLGRETVLYAVGMEGISFNGQLGPRGGADLLPDEVDEFVFDLVEANAELLAAGVVCGVTGIGCVLLAGAAADVVVDSLPVFIERSPHFTPDDREVALRIIHYLRIYRAGIKITQYAGMVKTDPGTVVRYLSRDASPDRTLRALEPVALTNWKGYELVSRLIDLGDGRRALELKARRTWCPLDACCRDATELVDYYFLVVPEPEPPPVIAEPVPDEPPDGGAVSSGSCAPRSGTSSLVLDQSTIAPGGSVTWRLSISEAIANGTPDLVSEVTDPGGAVLTAHQTGSPWIGGSSSALFLFPIDFGPGANTITVGTYRIRSYWYIASEGEYCSAVSQFEVVDAGPGGCLPQPEVCDGHDNDCDGLRDEGDVCTPRSCIAPYWSVRLDRNAIAPGESVVITYEVSGGGGYGGTADFRIRVTTPSGSVFERLHAADLWDKADISHHTFPTDFGPDASTNELGAYYVRAWWNQDGSTDCLANTEFTVR